MDASGLPKPRDIEGDRTAARTAIRRDSFRPTSASGDGCRIRRTLDVSVCRVGKDGLMALRLWVVLFTSIEVGGCVVGVRGPTGPLPCDFAVRIAANSQDHEKLIELARSGQGNEVVDDGRVVAEWLPVWPGGPAEKDLSENNDKDIVWRDNDGARQVLVVHGDSDVTEEHATHADYVPPSRGPFLVEVHMSEDGAQRLSSLTRSHLPDTTTEFRRRAAMVVTGRVYSLPKIEFALHVKVALEANSDGDARKLEATLNGVPESER